MSFYDHISKEQLLALLNVAGNVDFKIRNKLLIQEN